MNRPSLDSTSAIAVDPLTADAIERPHGVAENAVLRVFRVPPEAAGMRLDVFLQSQLRNTSRTRARLIVENSAYSCDGRRLRASERVKAEDRIALWRPALAELDAPTELRRLYEDEHLLVIDKPPLMAVHPTARHHHHTVLKLLEAQQPDQYFSLIHRLDRETSGILLVAKTKVADRGFKRMLEDRSLLSELRNVERRDAAEQVAKSYLAITWGVPESGEIQLPLELDKDNALRVKMRVAAPGTGLESHTTVQVLETAQDYALVRCELHTGRQHQIRVHLAAVGCPVVGDKLYGPDERMLARAADGELTEEDLARLELPRHALHAHRYTLPHAIRGDVLELEAPLARDLIEFWQSRGG